MELKQKLNEAIDGLNISMLTISKQTGIAYQTIRQISLKEDANPTAKTTRKLLDYLNKLKK